MIWDAGIQMCKEENLRSGHASGGPVLNEIIGTYVSHSENICGSGNLGLSIYL